MNGPSFISFKQSAAKSRCKLSYLTCGTHHVAEKTVGLAKLSMPYYALRWMQPLKPKQLIRLMLRWLVWACIQHTGVSNLAKQLCAPSSDSSASTMFKLYCRGYYYVLATDIVWCQIRHKSRSHRKMARNISIWGYAKMGTPKTNGLSNFIEAVDIAATPFAHGVA